MERTGGKQLVPAWGLVQVRLGMPMLFAKIVLTVLVVGCLFGIGLIRIADQDTTESIALDHSEQGLVVAAR